MSDEVDTVERVLSEWGEVYPELDASPLALIGRVLILAGQLQASVERALKKHSITLGQFDILSTLRRAGVRAELTPTELLRSVVLSSGGMTSRLDKLQAAGWIQRKPDPSDRRGTLVSLTKEGMKLIDAATKTRFAEAKKSMPELTPAQCEQLTKHLKTWLAQRGATPKKAKPSVR
jgi:DNA-binding MarR family transcriptional regulator